MDSTAWYMYRDYVAVLICTYITAGLLNNYVPFGSLVILDVARCYLWLFTLYINMKIGKNSC